MNRYRETLHRWAAQYVPEGATVVKVRVEYDDGYDPTFTDRPESLSVMIEYKPGPNYGGYGYAEIEMRHATSIGELLTELFRIEDESEWMTLENPPGEQTGFPRDVTLVHRPGEQWDADA